MRYIGSKASAAEQVLQIVTERIGSGTFCDPFGGIGVVSSAFKSFGFKVYTGDILKFAHYFLLARIAHNKIPNFEGPRRKLGGSTSDWLTEHMAGLPRNPGWFTQQYAEYRGFFTSPNAMAIEACWLEIGRWFGLGLINEGERAFLLASLIDSADRVANTTGTYYAYLKHLYRKARKPFFFKLIEPTPGLHRGVSWLAPALVTVSRRIYDVLYLDPPYNRRAYSRYYHLPESLALGIEWEVQGKAGMPVRNHVDSPFSHPGQAILAFRKLLEKARCRCLVMHYSDDGLIPPQEIRRYLRERGKVSEFLVQSKGYTTNKIARRMFHRLYVVGHE